MIAPNILSIRPASPRAAIDTMHAIEYADRALELASFGIGIADRTPLPRFASKVEAQAEVTRVVQQNGRLLAEASTYLGVAGPAAAEARRGVEELRAVFAPFLARAIERRDYAKMRALGPRIDEARSAVAALAPPTRLAVHKGIATARPSYERALAQTILKAQGQQLDPLDLQALSFLGEVDEGRLLRDAKLGVSPMAFAQVEPRFGEHALRTPDFALLTATSALGLRTTHGQAFVGDVIASGEPIAAEILHAVNGGGRSLANSVGVTPAVIDQQLAMLAAARDSELTLDDLRRVPALAKLALTIGHEPRESVADVFASVANRHDATPQELRGLVDRLRESLTLDTEAGILATRARIERGETLEPGVLAAIIRGGPAMHERVGLSIGAAHDQVVERLSKALGDGTDVGVLDTLHAARTALNLATFDQAPLMALRDETIEMVDRNIARMQGELDDGYARYPDFAELGRVLSNGQLLRSVHDAQAAARAGAAAAADGVISW